MSKALLIVGGVAALGVVGFLVLRGKGAATSTDPAASGKTGGDLASPDVQRTSVGNFGSGTADHRGGRSVQQGNAPQGKWILGPGGRQVWVGANPPTACPNGQRPSRIHQADGTIQYTCAPSASSTGGKFRNATLAADSANSIEVLA